MDLESLLLEVLPDTFGWRKRVSTLNSRLHSMDFALTDNNACTQCEVRGNSCEEKEVAKFSVNGTEVVTYDIEGYLNQYANHYKKAKGSRCDYLHIDTSQKYFVLNELTCTAEEYVNPYTNSSGPQDGKREKARRQINAVIGLLMSVKELDSFINSHPRKIGLFSWRIPTSTANEAETAMNMFMQPQQAVEDITTLSNIDGGFEFIQQIYPCRFVFDKG